MPRFFGGVALVQFLMPDPSAGTKMQAAQAQCSGMGTPDRVEIKGIPSTYLLLARILKKANSGRAAPDFPPAHLRWQAPVCPGISHPKTGIPGRK